MNFQIGIMVEDASHEEKGFYKATIAWKYDGVVYTTEAHGRGQIRSVGFALIKFGGLLLKAFPEYPEAKAG